MKKEHLITSVVLLLLWTAAAFAVKNDILIPSPYATFKYLCTLLVSPAFYRAAAATIFRIMTGFAVSLVLALILSILCSLYPVFRRYFEPVQILIRTIPNVSYIIIALIWLGSQGSVMLVSFMILFPIFMNGFLNRLDTDEKTCMDVEAVYPEKASVRIAKKILPELSGEILSTGRTAASMGFKVGVMAEILGSVHTGIGRSISYCRLDLNTAGIFAWTIVLIMISLLMDTLFTKLITIKKKEEQGWKD